MNRTLSSSCLLALTLSASAGTSGFGCSQANPGASTPATDLASPEAVPSTSPRKSADSIPATVSEFVALASQREPEEKHTFERISTPLFPISKTPDRNAVSLDVTSDSQVMMLVLSESTWALSQPFADGERIGMVRGGVPVRYSATVINDDCEYPWVEVFPRGFVCVKVRATRARDLAVLAKRKKRLAKRRRRALSGSYAIAGKTARFYRSLEAAKAGGQSRPARGDMLRKASTITTDDGRTFWKTQRGEYIDAADVRRLWGSRFAGVDLRTRAAAIAFAVNRRQVKAAVNVRRDPSDKAPVVGKVRARTVVDVLERKIDDPESEFIRIGDQQWIASADLRIVEIVQPPAEVGSSSTTRWADVDLGQQLVVIYEGTTPIFATLASTGRNHDPTPTGIFRVTRKKQRTTMASDRSRRQTYSAAVPWATYFNEGYAFHSAYWHDGFGKARSHGCVNLSPSDARTVYSLLGPEVPEGWTIVYGNEQQLGSVVSIRDSVESRDSLEEKMRSVGQHQGG